MPASRWAPVVVLISSMTSAEVFSIRLAAGPSAAPADPESRPTTAAAARHRTTRRQASNGTVRS